MHRNVLNLAFPGLVGGLSSFLLAATAAAQSPLLDIPGDAASDRLGTAVGAAGDVDGDGLPDLIAGAVEVDPGFFTTREGWARAFRGNTGATLFTWDGNAAFQEFGNAVDGAGDVNGDGRADLVVGVHLFDGGGTARGRALVFSGLDGSVLADLVGTLDGQTVGEAVSGAGDVTGDGRADVLVGAPGDPTHGSNAGRAFVIDGASGTVVLTLSGAQSAGERFGKSVSDLDDVNGDGKADVLVGTLSNGVYCLSGANGSVLYHVMPPSSSDVFGIRLDRVPDVDGDGVNDFVVGATQELPFSPGTGYVELRSGSNGTLLQHVAGSAVGDRFGISVAGVGDWNGDGTGDFAAGADGGAGSGNEYVRVLSGADGSVLLDLAAPVAGERFGAALAGLGDINGDGTVELAVGAPNASPNGLLFSGRVLVYSGTGGGVTCTDPVVYCVSSPNSVGNGADIAWAGSASVSANDLVLLCTGLPTGQFGLFFYGHAPVQIPFGNGFRCVGGPPLIRMPILTVGIGGIVSQNFDVTSPGNPLGAVGVGDVRYFQLWYRDPAAGGANFNLSDALEVHFCP